MFAERRQRLPEGHRDRGGSTAYPATSRRHPDHELLRVGGDSGTPSPAARRAVVLSGGQFAVPA